MCSASGRIALRVRMGMHLLAKGLDFLAGVAHGLTHADGSGASWDIVNREHRGKFQRFVEILTESRAERLQIGERKIVKLATFFNAELDGFANALVGEARRHAVV